MTIDNSDLGSPLGHLSDIPAGDYFVQAMGNVYSLALQSDGTLLAWGAGLVVVLLSAGLSTWLFFDSLAAYAKRTDPKVSPLAAAESAQPH